MPNRRDLPANIPADDDVWADQYIDALIEETIRRRGKIGLVESLAGDLLAHYRQSAPASDAEDFGSHEPRLRALVNEAIGRRWRRGV